MSGPSGGEAMRYLCDVMLCCALLHVSIYDPDDLEYVIVPA